jgi:ubiquinone/menaquinone biosynthesis C-methylase UbiE
VESTNLTAGSEASHYALTPSPHEARRLLLQSEIIRPVTERWLREAGIGLGMRVLDVGCGTGEVTAMVAELVGEGGRVVGVDQSKFATDIARMRAEKFHLQQMSVVSLPIEDYRPAGLLDAVVGRYILHHQKDPAKMLLYLAGFVRPGGILAFHELGMGPYVVSQPGTEVWAQAMRWINAVLVQSGGQADAAFRLLQIYDDAGLGMPAILCETIVSGGRFSPFYDWLATTVRSLLPRIVELGIATEVEVDIDTLEDRLRNSAIEQRVQLLSPPQFCAWAHKP